MDKTEIFLTWIIILELFVFGSIIIDNRPNTKYLRVITDFNSDRCYSVDNLDIVYYNHTQKTVDIVSCRYFVNHTYHFFINDEYQLSITEKNYTLYGLTFNVTKYDLPIELRLFDVDLKKTVGIEFIYLK